MEVLVAVIALAGALLAAIATGALVNRLRTEPAGWLIAWSVATAALCVSLGVMAAGQLLGFGTLTFRAYQLTGSLLAPLWLAVGVIQLLARKPAAKFGSWLPGAGITAVGLVILLVDPVRQEKDFAKTLPAADHHWNPPPFALLTAVQVFVAAVLLAGLVVAVLRWRNGDDYDTDNMHALGVLAPTGLALVGACAFGAPGTLIVLLHLLVAAAVWYAVLRPLAPYDDEDDDDFEEDDWEDRRPKLAPPRDVQVAGRRTVPEGSPGAAPGQLPSAVPGTVPSAVPGTVPGAAPGQPPRRSGLGDLVAEYRAGEQDVDYAARMRQPGQAGQAHDDPFGGPATGTFMAGEYGMPLTGRSAADHDYTQPPPRTGQFGVPPEAGPTVGPTTGEFGVPPAAGPATGEYSIPLNEFGGHAASRGVQDRASRPMPAEEAFGARRPMSAEDAFGAPPAPAHSGAAPGTPPVPDDRVRLSPSIFGLLTVFTLIDGTGEAFDRLAEETVEIVRGSEPDTLIYACHSVKSAPLQRIVYELYRDEVAYREHQSQPHVERFVAERQGMVLATNVIELNVNAAKVIPLPTAFRI
ncbi:antibiotic biosynthesis monooxygenase [Planomonospora algeriensis]